MTSAQTSDLTVILENEFTRLEMQNGYLIINWKCKFLDANVCKKLVSDRRALTKGVAYPALLKIKSLNDSTKEARDFLASNEGCEGLKAVAIFVDSVAEDMMANLFVQLNKPVIPVKIFNDEEKAKQWLLQYV